ncbi:MAG: transposase, partial [Gammaproteobacteria bacterium]|nr:transposase [Gammaproteobacteria bacterium]
TAYVNKLEKRTGSLWEGRYKASPIQRDEYLLACCRYVEMNPVRANMVAGPRQYKWSSYRERLGLVKPRMLDYDPTFLALGNDQARRNEQYKRFLQTDISSEEIELLSNAWKRNQLTGSKRFVEEVEERTGLRSVNCNRGRPVS